MEPAGQVLSDRLHKRFPSSFSTYVLTAYKISKLNACKLQVSQLAVLDSSIPCNIYVYVLDYLIVGVYFNFSL